jgi:hypothetical protein
MFAEIGEKKPPNDAMQTMNRFWFLVKTEWTGPAVETVARLSRWGGDSPSWAVCARSRSPSLGKLWSVSETRVAERPLLRLASVPFMTTQLLAHLEGATDVCAGPYPVRRHRLHLASRLRSEHRIYCKGGRSPRRSTQANWRQEAGLAAAVLAEEILATLT